MNLSFICYYVIVLLSNLSYFYVIKRNRLPIFSVSTISYCTSILLIMLPGYYVANGDIINTMIGGRLSFDKALYLLYLAFVILSTFGLLIGQTIAKNHYLMIVKKKDIKARIYLVLFCIIIYDIIYLVWIPYNPLLSIISNLDISEVAIQRLAISHGIGNYTDVPFIFRYWRMFLQVFSPILIFYCLRWMNFKFWVKICLFLFQTFLLLFTVEKVQILYLSFFIISIIALTNTKYIIQNKISKIINKKIIVIFILSIIMLVISYSSFMGSRTPITSIITRMSRQSASTRLMIEYVKESGFIGYKGLNMPIIRNLFHYDYINLSKLAIIEIYPSANTTELAGSAGGMSLAQLYFMFGWYSLIIYFIAICFMGFIDNVLFNTYFRVKNLKDEGVRIFGISYAFLCSFYMMSLGSSIFTWFSFPLVLSPEMILLCIFLGFFIKIRRYV